MIENRALAFHDCVACGAQLGSWHERDCVAGDYSHMLDQAEDKIETLNAALVEVHAVLGVVREALSGPMHISLRKQINVERQRIRDAMRKAGGQ